MFAQFQSCGVGLQHHVRIFRYSTRLLCNLSVKFVIKVLTIRIASEATERDHFEKRNSPIWSFRLVSWESSDQTSRKYVKFITLLNRSKKAHSRKNELRWFFLLLKFSQQFTSLGDHTSSYVNTEKLWETNWITETPCRVSEDSQRKLILRVTQTITSNSW